MFNLKLPASIKINFEINLKKEEGRNKVIGEKLENENEKKEENEGENK